MVRIKGSGRLSLSLIFTVDPRFGGLLPLWAMTQIRVGRHCTKEWAFMVGDGRELRSWLNDWIGVDSKAFRLVVNKEAFGNGSFEVRSGDIVLGCL